jgi:hypothetical protein
LCGVNNGWANLVDIFTHILEHIASIQGLILLTSVQPGSMETRLFCEHLVRTVASQTTTKSMLHTYSTSECRCLSAEKKSSMQVPRSCRWKC